MRWTFYEEDVIPLSFAEMDYDIAPPVRAALTRAVGDQAVTTVRDGAGVSGALREAFTGFTSRCYGWAPDPAQVFLTHGVLRGMELALQNYLPAGSQVVLPTPAYQQFFSVVKLAGHTVRTVEALSTADGARLDVDGIDQALREGAKAVILCNPHNPLGRAYGREELQELADVVQARNARVFSDEIHAPLTYAARQHVPYASVSAAAGQHTVTFMAATKAWNLAGFPCAQIVMSADDDAARWRRISPLATAGISTLSLWASLAAYRDGGAWLAEACGYIERCAEVVQARLAEELPEVRVLRPEATYMGWVDCAGLGLGEDPSEWFLRHARVATFPGRLFGPGSADHMRLCFPTSLHYLNEAITRLVSAVRGPSWSH